MKTRAFSNSRKLINREEQGSGTNKQAVLQKDWEKKEQNALLPAGRITSWKMLPVGLFLLVRQAAISALRKLSSVGSKLPSETTASWISGVSSFMKPRTVPNTPLLGKTPLNEINVEMWLMMSQQQTLSYQSRREVLAHFLPCYQSASRPQKSLLLNAFVKITSYARKSAAAQPSARGHWPHPAPSASGVRL